MSTQSLAVQSAQPDLQPYTLTNCQKRNMVYMLLCQLESVSKHVDEPEVTVALLALRALYERMRVAEF